MIETNYVQRVKICNRIVNRKYEWTHTLVIVTYRFFLCDKSFQINDMFYLTWKYCRYQIAWPCTSHAILFHPFCKRYVHSSCSTWHWKGTWATCTPPANSTCSPCTGRSTWTVSSQILTLQHSGRTVDWFQLKFVLEQHVRRKLTWSVIDISGEFPERTNRELFYHFLYVQKFLFSC